MSKREYSAWMGKMHALTNEEIKEFLAGPIVARVAMVKLDGSPYLAPVWEEYDGEALCSIPRKNRPLRPTFRPTPHLAISCALDHAPYTRVLFQGKTEIVEGPKPMEGFTLEIAWRMAVRYVGTGNTV